MTDTASTRVTPHCCRCRTPQSIANSLSVFHGLSRWSDGGTTHCGGADEQAAIFTGGGSSQVGDLLLFGRHLCVNLFGDGPLFTEHNNTCSLAVRQAGHPSSGCRYTHRFGEARRP